MFILRMIRNFGRHTKDAFLAIIRNGAMASSTIFAVTITLTLVSTLIIAAVTLSDLTKSVENNLIIYAKLDNRLTEDDELFIRDEINRISEVSNTTYFNKTDELTRYIGAFGEDGVIFESFYNDNPMGASIEVEVYDAINMQLVSEKIREIYGVVEVHDGGEYTAGLISGFEKIRLGGVIFVASLIVLAIFFIANTIKLTISARRVEIGIMRLVGASNWYITVPFMLEGMMLGLIGAILPILATYYGYNYFIEITGGTLVSSMFGLRPAMPFVKDVSLLLLAIGSSVGLIGSFSSIRKYLKV